MWIDSIKVDGGMLNDFEHKFDRRLNVVIGGRGTGKSSVIELLRFCLGSPSLTEAGQVEAKEHALGILGDGRVTVTLATGDTRLTVSRTAQDTDSEPFPEAGVPLVFSQAEIETIGLKSRSRIRLIDAFLDASDRPSAEGGSSAKIRSICAEIKNLLGEIDDIDEKTIELPKLLKQLQDLKEQTAAQSVYHKALQGHRKLLAEITPLLSASSVRAETIRRASNDASSWIESLNDLIDTKSAIEPWPDEAGGSDELADLRRQETRLDTQLNEIADKYEAIVKELAGRESQATAQKAGLENRARDVRQKIEEIQKGASVLDKKISDISQQISVLQSLLSLRKEREKKLARLTTQRTEILELQSKVRAARTLKREAIADRLNKQLSPAIRITINPYSLFAEYEDALTSALRGSGLRYRELARRITETYTPQEIALISESRDIDSITGALELTDERAFRLCDALRGDAGAALFTVNVDDDVLIELLDGTDYKSIEFLSMGQRCTVILPIILCHTDRIIILDQPEDHLDNAFVVGTLVKSISARSQKAQTIVATHNPNIPVLGDANRVLQMDSDGSSCFKRCTGALTSTRVVKAITGIMEGGHDAFLRRASFYEENL